MPPGKEVLQTVHSKKKESLLPFPDGRKEKPVLRLAEKGGGRGRQAVFGGEDSLTSMRKLK